MITLFIIIGVIFLLVLLYLFFLVKPCAKKPQNNALLCDYAHRGLHDDLIPENSLLAFENATKNGFGIELDVQLSKDGTVMVFHDYSLLRVTGIDRKLSELNSNELTKIKLLKTEQCIPTLKEVLNLVDGKVPLLVELKGEMLDTSLCPKVAALLKEYKGAYCIESFNPFLIKNMRKYLPDAYYGQLYTNSCREKKKYNFLSILSSSMALNFISKPNFIAFNKLDRNSLPVKLTTKIYKCPKFVWTTNGEKEREFAHLNNENAIFEIK